MNRSEKNKLMVGVRFELPEEYHTILKIEAEKTHTSMADIVLRIINWQGTYLELKIAIMKARQPIGKFVANKVMKYYENKIN